MRLLIILTTVFCISTWADVVKFETSLFDLEKDSEQLINSLTARLETYKKYGTVIALPDPDDAPAELLNELPSPCLLVEEAEAKQYFDYFRSSANLGDSESWRATQEAVYCINLISTPTLEAEKYNSLLLVLKKPLGWPLNYDEYIIRYNCILTATAAMCRTTLRENILASAHATFWIPSLEDLEFLGEETSDSSYGTVLTDLQTLPAKILSVMEPNEATILIKDMLDRPHVYGGNTAKLSEKLLYIQDEIKLQKEAPRRQP